MEQDLRRGAALEVVVDDRLRRQEQGAEAGAEGEDEGAGTAPCAQATHAVSGVGGCQQGASGDEDAGDDEEAGARAHQWQQDEAAGQRADDGAGGVGGVDGSRAARPLGDVACVDLDREREGFAEEHGGHHDEDACDEELREDADRAEGAAGDPGQRPHQGPERARCHMGQHGERGDAGTEPQLEGDQVSRRIGVAVDDAPRPSAAVENTEEEAREHDGKGIDGSAEGLHENAHPYDLEGERRHARERNGDEHGAPRTVRRRRHGLSLGGRGVLFASQAGGERDRREADDDVDHQGCRHRSRGPEQGQEDEAGGQRTEERAQGVHRIEQPDPSAKHLGEVGEAADDEGKRRPHEQGGNQQKGGGNGEAEAVIKAWKGLEVRSIDGPIGFLESTQQVGEKGGEDGDRHLAQAVDQERPSNAVAPPPGAPAPKRQPDHENAEGDGCGVDVAPEEERQHPRPRHLVGQRSGSREQEDQGHHWHQPPSRVRAGGAHG